LKPKKCCWSYLVKSSQPKVLIGTIWHILKRMTVKRFFNYAKLSKVASLRKVQSFKKEIPNQSSGPCFVPLFRFAAVSLYKWLRLHMFVFRQKRVHFVCCNRMESTSPRVIYGACNRLSNGNLTKLAIGQFLHKSRTPAKIAFAISQFSSAYRIQVFCMNCEIQSWHLQFSFYGYYHNSEV
jgi:hypothetical protein